MADVVGQAEEKERRLNKSRKKLERKLVSCFFQYAAFPLTPLNKHHRPVQICEQ